jgi:uncharacterized protein
MPEYLAPGVYIEEFEIGPRPIEGVSTSTAGLLGETKRGPLEPRLVTGLEQFTRLYGGFLPIDQSNLPFAVDGFFRNGGQRCFIGRVAAGDAAAAFGVHDGKMRIEAIGPGTWGNQIAVKIEPASVQLQGAPVTRFKLTVMYWDDPPPTPLVDPTAPANATNPNRRTPTLLEVYDGLSATRSSIDFYEKRITSASSLIRVTEVAPDTPSVPLALDFLPNINGAPGTAGSAVVLADYQGRELPPLPDGTVHKSGLLGFEQVDEIAIVAAPDHHKVAGLTDDLINQCELLKDRFAVLHSDPGRDTLGNIQNIRPPRDTQYAAFYFPWIKVFNPLVQQDSLVPPTGHIVGIYANTDVERGVFKAPANAVVRGANSLQFQITKREQDLLNPRGVNCVRSFPARGIRVWGARTSSTNSLWKYINVRRLFIFIEESIDEGTQWVVFEPNDERLWARVKQTITQFLTTQWRAGALMGTTAEEAFFVKVDRTTMTQDDIDNGRLICIIGLAPVKPAEFVIFRLAQFSGGSEITEV